MRTYLTVVTSVVVGMGIGGFAVQGLNAQAKKVYTVSETETLDAKLAAEFAPRIGAAQTAAGGRNLGTAGGKVVGLEGAPPPSRVGIVEWDSLEKAEAFYKSKPWTDLAPEREKGVKTIRRYSVEQR